MAAGQDKGRPLATASLFIPACATNESEVGGHAFGYRLLRKGFLVVLKDFEAVLGWTLSKASGSFRGDPYKSMTMCPLSTKTLTRRMARTKETCSWRATGLD